MNRHIKSFLTFTGGAAVGLIFGSAGVIAAELSSKRIRDALKGALSDWIDETLFPENSRKSYYRRVHYNAHYN